MKCNSRIKQNIKLCLKINQMPEHSLEVKFTEATRPLLGYIEINYKEMAATFIRGPKLSDVPYPVPMEPNLVIEYYSR